MTSFSKYLIIGGGPAGTIAAETIRQLDVSGSITIVTAEPYRFYSRVMLSKPSHFFRSAGQERIWLKTPEWYENNKITLLSGKRATILDPHTKTITLQDGNTIGYEKLLLAHGSEPRPWELPGATKAGVYYLRNFDDVERLRAAIKTAQQAVVIGAGFIGFEMCDLLCQAKVKTTLLMREEYFWQPTLDPSSGSIIEAALTTAGISIIKESEAKQVLGGDCVESLVLQDDQHLPCDLVVVGIGVIYPLGWLASSGLTVNRGVMVNEYLETNLPDVWAAGDVAEFHDLILDETVVLGNWMNAQAHGRVVGANMVGQKQAYKKVSFYSTSGFGTSIAFAGDVRPLPDRMIIERPVPEKKSHVRFVVQRNEIVGATLVNDRINLGYVMKLIENNVKVSPIAAQLADPATDLKTLLYS